MASKVGICNIGLRALGEKRISSLTEGNPAARACNSAYDDVREAVLRDHPWNCCTERAALAALAEAPVWEFPTQFQLPGDFLRLIRLESPNIKYRVEGLKILADDGAPLNIEYVANIDNPGQYDALLVQAMGLYLGWSIAEELSKDRALKNAVWTDYLQVRSAATSVDAMEGTPRQFHSDDFLIARL